jgi:retron-type reverse transcriptase
MFKCLLSEVQYEVTVPTVKDRVIQAAMKQVLEPIFEAGCAAALAMASSIG